MVSISYRSECAMASALDIVGDKWSLIVVRGMFVGQTRYRDFLKTPESIATNILADRLRLLETAGIIERTHHQYRLTRKGADLLPAVQALARWGYKHIPGRWRPPAWFLKAKPSDFYPKN